MRKVRCKQILEYLEEERFAKVEELSVKFNVSTETIRRDLKILENETMVRRVHGGAIFEGMRSREIKYDNRERKQYREKLAIARVTADLVEDGDSIVMNTGTTTLEVARQLSNKNNLTVVTNSISIAVEMVENETNKVFLTSGQLRKSGLGLSGVNTAEYLSKFRFDKSIISVGGISVENGVSDYHIEESDAVRKMINVSDENIIVADYSKINITALNLLCDIDSVDILVTDWNVSTKDILNFKRKEVRVLIPDKND